jgi:putative transposase
MPKRRFSAEQIVTLLRQIEVLMAQGKSAPEACQEAGISQQSFYRWRKEYGGLEIDQAKRMKELERENVRLKRVVSENSIQRLNRMERENQGIMRRDACCATYVWPARLRSVQVARSASGREPVPAASA